MKSVGPRKTRVETMFSEVDGVDDESDDKIPIAVVPFDLLSLLLLQRFSFSFLLILLLQNVTRHSDLEPSL